MWLQDTLAIVLSRFNDNQWTPFVVISGTEPGNALPSPSETSVDHTGPTHHHGWDLITLRVLVCIYIYTCTKLHTASMYACMFVL